MSTMSMSTMSTSTISPIHLITISPSPSLCHHLSVTILAAQFHHHNLAITISPYQNLAFSLSQSQSCLHHLGVTIFHRPLTFSAICQTKMLFLSLSQHETAFAECAEQNIKHWDKLCCILPILPAWTLGDPWRYAWKWPKLPFSGMSPMVAKGRQGSRGNLRDGWDELKPDRSYLSHFPSW